MSVFVTGTDTGIGKTLVSSWICLHTRADYWKPIQTGNEKDSKQVHLLAQNHVYPESYLLKKTLSPFAAAESERKKIDPKKIILPAPKNLIVEGAGGLFVPIATHYCMIDLIADLNLPVILVARVS